MDGLKLLFSYLSPWLGFIAWMCMSPWTWFRVQCGCWTIFSMTEAGS